MADRFEHPNQMIRPHGKHDRKVKLQDPHPVYQKLLPQCVWIGFTTCSTAFA